MSVTVARDLEHALATLDSDPDAMILAGGTDAMVALNSGHRRPSSVVAIDRVTELQGWHLTDSVLRIGACVTYRELESPAVEALVPALAQAARTVGSPQIRNAGTIGGNIGTSSPAGDTLPVLAALDAIIELRSTRDAREVAWRDFFTGPKRNSRAPGELIVAVRVPLRRGPQEFLKVGTRNAMVIAVASVCLVVDLDAAALACALGSVGPVPLRADDAESWARDTLTFTPTGIAADDTACRTFGELVASAARPIDDQRGSAAYRRHAVSVCARRALRRATEL